jgi:hypothetical protein
LRSLADALETNLQETGLRLALQQEREALERNRQMGVGGYDRPGFTDQFTAPINDEIAWLAGYGSQSLSNLARNMAGRPVEVSALDRARAMRQISNEGQDRFAEERPVQAFTGGLLGGVAMAPARGAAIPGMIGRLGTEAGLGAAYGAAEGDSLSDRLSGAGFGAGVGLALGGAAEFAAPHIGRLVNRFRNRGGSQAVEALGVPALTNQTEAEAALARYRAAYPEATNARVLSPGDEGYPTNAQWDEASQTYVEPVAPIEPDYPIRAFHGSPHSFDQFELSPRTIGTGEGAQAFGHGLYFAENEGIARGYRDAAVDPDSVPLQFRGKPVDTPWNDDIRERWADDFAGLSEDDADAFEELLGNLSQVNNLNDVKNVLGNVSPRARALYNSRVRSDLVKPDFGPGSMYEVGINASPDTFLDWDRPLSEQSEAVRRGYAQARASGDPLVADLLGDLSNPAQMNNAGLFPNSGGAQAYNSLTPEAAEASRRLNEYGISGIRYLDANSREAGEGLRNYVVFNDELVKILRKYGISGLSTTVGASALAEELDRRGQTQEF